MNNALAIIDKARTRGVAIYTAPNLDTPPLFKPEVTEIAARPDEFHKIDGGKLMPAKAVVDRIGDAAGINYIDSNCTVTAEARDDQFGKRTVFIGRAQGKVRISDGSWRTSTVEEYEFDPLLRAKAEGGDEKKVLAYLKVARQRAATGARVRVVRQLTGMPTALTPEEANRPMLFARIVQNTDYILETAEGRQMAVANALGITERLYGPRPGAQQIGAPAERDVTPEGADEFAPQGNATDSEPDPKLVYLSTMQDYLEKYSKNLGPTSPAVLKMQNMVRTPDSFTLDEITTLLAKARDVLVNLKVLQGVES
jgi:hypothetical protein